MEENVFLVRWYGPFTTPEAEKGWEKKQKFKCSLYLIHGKLKYAKSREMYYCGESTRSIYKRFRDKDHHIHEIKERLNSIYVGCISNIKSPTRRQILLIEKIVTAYLTENVGQENMLNAVNFYYPNKNVYIINEWWKTNGMTIWSRQPINAPSHIVPDVLNSHYIDKNNVDLYGCRKLKQL